MRDFYTMLSPKERQRMKALCLSEGESDQQDRGFVSMDMPSEESTNIFYDLDEDGSIIMDIRGKVVINRLHDLTLKYFGHDLFNSWEQQDQGDKDKILDILYREFPQPNRFNDKWAKTSMCTHIRHKRQSLRRLCSKGKKRPGWASKKDWEKVVYESKHPNPERFKQQREATKSRLNLLGQSHLGSGGKANMHAQFVSNSLLANCISYVYCLSIFFF